MTTISEYLEDLIKDCGGFGRFQFLLAAIVLCANLSVAWTTLMMSFAGAVPDWWCSHNSSYDMRTSNTSQPMKSCMADNTTECDSFTFENSMHTVVSEFSLVCDKDWVIATITTIQMSGLLVGSFISGHLSDYLGRKPVFFLSLAILCVTNVVAYFSVSWQMFAVVRFFLGFGGATYLAVYFPFLMEFIAARQRPYIAGFPSWQTWASAMGLAAYLLPNWAYLHLVTAICIAPWLFTWWFVPESFRWLVIHKKYDEAEAVIQKMARVNGAVSQDLKNLRKLSVSDVGQLHKYTMLDLFKEKYLAKTTLLHAIMWFSCGYVYYAIAFGVQKLSGSLYLNIFLINAVEIPGNAITIFTSNLVGRKWTSCGFFLLSGLASLVVGVIDTMNIDAELSGRLVNTFALIAKLCVAAGWCSLHTLTSEVYPTVIRNVGYGFQNTATRLGGILAPQMVFLTNKYNGILYYLSGALMLCSSLSAFMSSETRDTILADTLGTMHVNIDHEKEIKTYGENKPHNLNERGTVGGDNEGYQPDIAIRSHDDNEPHHLNGRGTVGGDNEEYKPDDITKIRSRDYKKPHHLNGRETVDENKEYQPHGVIEIRSRDDNKPHYLSQRESVGSENEGYQPNDVTETSYKTKL